MKIHSLALAIISISILVFNNLHQVFVSLTQPTINPSIVTGFILAVFGVTVYIYYNRKLLKKWM